MKRAELATSFLAEAAGCSPRRWTTSRRSPGRRLAVPRIADWCAVDIVRSRRARSGASAMRHARSRPARRSAAQLARGYPADVRRLHRHRRGHPHRTRRSSSSNIPAGDARGLRPGRRAPRSCCARSSPTAVIVAPMISGHAVARHDHAGLVRITPRRLSRPTSRWPRSSAGARAPRSRARACSPSAPASPRSCSARCCRPSLPAIPGALIEARYAASGELNEVGGDFYDVFEYDASRWMIAIGDVCGKGPRAASVTALARHTLRAAAMRGSAPARMLAAAARAPCCATPGATCARSASCS